MESCKQILVIDDEQASLERVINLLRFYPHYRAISCQRYVDAVNYILNNEVNLVLLDNQLDKTRRGIDLAKDLSERLPKGTPIILWSAHITPQEILNHKRKKLTKYLHKALDDGDLLADLIAHLQDETQIPIKSGALFWESQLKTQLVLYPQEIKVQYELHGCILAKSPHFTSKELKILTLLFETSPKKWSKDNLAEKFYSSPNSITTHIKNINQKIQDDIGIAHRCIQNKYAQGYYIEGVKNVRRAA